MPPCLDLVSLPLCFVSLPPSLAILARRARSRMSAAVEGLVLFILVCGCPVLTRFGGCDSCGCGSSANHS